MFKLGNDFYDTKITIRDFRKLTGSCYDGTIEVVEKYIDRFIPPSEKFKMATIDDNSVLSLELVFDILQRYSRSEPTHAEVLLLDVVHEYLSATKHSPEEVLELHTLRVHTRSDYFETVERLLKVHSEEDSVSRLLDLGLIESTKLIPPPFKHVTGNIADSIKNRAIQKRKLYLLQTNSATCPHCRSLTQDNDLYSLIVEILLCSRFPVHSDVEKCEDCNETILLGFPLRTLQAMLFLISPVTAKVLWEEQEREYLGSLMDYTEATAWWMHIYSRIYWISDNQELTMSTIAADLDLIARWIYEK